MILFHKPDSPTIKKFLDAQQTTPFTYSGLGMTRNNTSPEDYLVLNKRIQIGTGEDDFVKAKELLNHWQMCQLGWVEVIPAEDKIESNLTLAINVNVFGLWMLNAAQIIYVFDELSGKDSYYGFAYGTLADHAESGEERFMIEMLEDGSVWYDIFSFSKPHWKLAKLASPYVRYLQRKFINESINQMIVKMNN